jgi:predicted alpha/beta superfamily hydrolase
VSNPRRTPGILLTCALLSGACRAPANTPDPIPPHQSFTIRSAVLQEDRLIHVYTPPGYDDSADVRFPVLFMPDGGLNEDFPHIANTIDSLIRLGRIPPIVVVGIPNTERRRDLTGPTTAAKDSAIAPRVGESASFRRFIREELMPEVQQRYRLTEETATVGESLAGMFVVETFLLDPDLFDRYIAVSPSLWWNRNGLLKVARSSLRAEDDRPRVLYLTAADEPGIEAETAALAATINSRPPRGLRWTFVPRSDLSHSTIFRAVVPNAFVWALN